MKSVLVAKPTKDVVGLQKKLEADGFQLDGVVSSLTETRVWLKDAETKDPTPVVLAWADLPILTVSSNKPAGPGGIPEASADGVDKHILTIKKVNPATGAVVPGSEQLQILPSQFVSLSSAKPVLVAGQVMVEVGPSQMAGEVDVKVYDPAGNLGKTQLRLRFA